MAEREVRYCTSDDGVRIAYCIEGEGPVLVVPPYLFESFLLDHLSPGHQSFMARLTENFRTVRYDLRCTGSSQRDVADVSFDAHVRDLSAVVRAAGQRRFSLFGRAAGGLFALAYAANSPKNVERLMLYGMAPRLQDLFGADALAAFAKLADANWETASNTLADVSGRRLYGETGRENARWYQRSTTGREAAHLIEAVIDADTTASLGHIRCPTLVLQPMDDPAWLPEHGQRIAQAIPGASFVAVPGSWHTIAFGDPEPVLHAVFDFMGVTDSRPRKRAGGTAIGGSLATILFTDLASSTALTQRLGDAKLHEIRRVHNTIVRDALAAFGGTEIKHTGDGIMASFGSARGALECAIAVQRGVAERGDPNLGVHIGLNAGEPIVDERDLFGTSVDLARRVCDEASGGEILVSDVVRQLAAGKEFLFSDRGVADLKGFDEPVRLFEVRWQAEGSPEETGE
jgi:class 3 adenylate cyclase